jgi:DMSO/TMAO reductase YedYZ heme-binding membrane subunit
MAMMAMTTSNSIKVKPLGNTWRRNRFLAVLAFIVGQVFIRVANYLRRAFST